MLHWRWQFHWLIRASAETIEVDFQILRIKILVDVLYAFFEYKYCIRSEFATRFCGVRHIKERCVLTTLN